MLLINARTLTLRDAHDTSLPEIFEGQVRIRNGRIEAMGHLTAEVGEEVVDLSGKLLMPGFIHAHIHLCQTLFRNAAEHLELLDWLKQRIWPLEAAHSPESLYQTARLALIELIKGGTTGIMDMGTVHHTDSVFLAAQESGIRAHIGKAMMDIGDEVPAGLKETTESSLKESCRLLEAWDQKEDGRLRYTFAPRFVPSCSPTLLRELVRLVEHYDGRIHTHASENRGEIALVKSMTGKDNIDYLDSLGLTGDHVGLAHCVWVTDQELGCLARTKTNVLHCPGSNLKLASGIAPIPRMRAMDIPVALGADGAPCNNRLDMFEEMRLAGLIQRPEHGPRVMEAREVVWMATRGGAYALGLGQELGKVAEGFLADLITLDLSALETTPMGDLYANIVYAAERSCVQDVMVQGRFVMRDRRLLTLNPAEVLPAVRREGKQVFERAGLAGLWH